MSQPTYVEKPKYMMAGRLFHSQRRYQSDKTHVASTQVGHALVEGKQMPTRAGSVCKAGAEAEFVSALLRSVGVEVHALMRQEAGKTDVQSKIEGAEWGLFACHGDLDRDALMLAEKEKTLSSGKKHPLKAQERHYQDLGGLERVRGVREKRRRRRRRGPRATVYWSKGFHQRRTSRWTRCRGACVWGRDPPWC